ncbi:hypothetical protein GQ43DRAFT_443036 [Delitschia confertaspora ATCC 74209]|uniref:Uncharacterized protein n=1 Tax=Delitschia confertaspora ATCC 74209 TaxID=1513339 RepID=A0A9P4MQ01_9PLEO|nr:hypothetical protein GQ43DRAFT_443036 [Delitschia confertaspora ATCC 74209]
MHYVWVVPLLFLSSHASPLPGPEEGLLLPRAGICGTEFTSGDAKKDADVWEKTGAAKYLEQFFSKNNVGNWTDTFFKQVVAGGSQGSSTFDCGNFPTTGQCQSPGTQACTSYKPNEAFFVHLAISNFYSAFYKLHEKLQDKAIIDIASTAKKITDVYGPPPTNQGPDMFAMLIGAFIFAGFIPGADVGAGAMVATLNLMAGGSKLTPAAQDPNTFKGELQDQLGKMFQVLQGGVETTVKQVLGGDLPDKIDGKDSKQWLINQFSKGAFVDKNTVGGLTDEWIKRYGAYLTDAMVVKAFKARKYPIAIMVHNAGGDWDQAKCRNQHGAMWFDNYGCAGFAWERPAPMTGAFYDYFTFKDFSTLDDIISDYSAALTNAVECLQAGTKDNKGLEPTGTPDFKTNNNFDKKTSSSYYPKCFWNIRRAYDGQISDINPPKPNKKTTPH